MVGFADEAAAPELSVRSEKSERVERDLDSRGAFGSDSGPGRADEQDGRLAIDNSSSSSSESI